MRDAQNPHPPPFRLYPPFQPIPHLPRRLPVQRPRRLVQDEQFRSPEERARDGETLRLAAREGSRSNTTATGGGKGRKGGGEGGVVALGEGEDEGVDRGGGGGGADGGEEGGGGRGGVGDVCCDGGSRGWEEGWVLGHEGDEGAEGRDVEVGDGDGVDC